MITIPLTIKNDGDTPMCTANITYNVNINIIIKEILKTNNTSTITKQQIPPQTITLNINSITYNRNIEN